MQPLPTHYREEAEREIRAANLPKLFAIAERVREAIDQTDTAYFARRSDVAATIQKKGNAK